VQNKSLLALASILTFCEKHFGNEVNKILGEVKSRNVFEQLIITIISQNTNWKNTWKAYINLKKAFGGISPEKILSTSEEALRSMLKPAGLYRAKSKVIKNVAKVFLEQRLHETLDSEKLREMLIKIPGIGPKTVDVVLAFSFNEPIIPVDTHIRRIAKRIGLVSSSNYEEIKECLEKNIPAKYRLKAHFQLISFGRKICKARKPLCSECPANTFCPSKTT